MSNHSASPVADAATPRSFRTPRQPCLQSFAKASYSSASVKSGWRQSDLANWASLGRVKRGVRAQLTQSPYILPFDLFLLLRHHNHCLPLQTSHISKRHLLHSEDRITSYNMSGPYDQYGGQQYGSQYPQQGYSGGGYPPQQGYQQQGYQQDYNQYPTQDFGPPRRADSFGPPQAGGFQHGIQGQTYGQYDASNPQGHAGYYGGQQQQGGYGQDAFSQNQQYQQQMGQGGAPQGQQQYPQTSPQSSDPNAPKYDPNAPAMTESDRGLLGAIGGGFGGHYLGKKANHGFMGTIGGAILGSLTEDFAKDKKKKKHGTSQGGGSSWGGSKW